MDKWYKVTISRQDVAGMKHMALQTAFEKLFTANGGPQDAAMFTRSEAKFPFEFFFSPGAAYISKALLAKFSAVVCDAPKASSLSLLVGASDASKLLKKQFLKRPTNRLLAHEFLSDSKRTA